MKPESDSAPEPFPVAGELAQSGEGGVEPEQWSPLDYFAEGFQRPGISPLYQAGLAVVAVAMMLLPVVYLALVGLAVYGTWHHATQNFEPIMAWPIGGRGAIIKLMAYGTPLLMGAAVSFFMIKPLFAPRRRHAQPYCVTRESEPLLYGFIERICQIVGSPRPRRIYLSADVNASASFRRGLLSFFGDDLALTIGLPLVAGLNMRQFAGVIAHEFGHFTQAAGMRLTYVIRRVNYWFARVVFERDAWDDRIEAWAEADEWRIQFMVNLARFGIWCSRTILRGLMMIGQAISGYALRQMEYHADQFEIRLAGSQAFEETARQLAVLGVATNSTYRSLQRQWERYRRLPDNLPAVILHSAASLPEATQQRIQNELGLAKTGLLDTHPSDADRIRQARRSGERGIFELELPARDLFQDFGVPARFVTQIHYEEELELLIAPEFLVPVQTAAPDGSAAQGG